MTLTINNIRNFALLGTIISASATAPAQAGLPKNINSDDDLTKASEKQTPFENQDILSDKQKCNPTDLCISFPEFDSQSQPEKTEDKNSLENLMLKKATTSYESISAGEKIQVKISDDGVKHIIYNAEFSPLESKEMHTAIYSSASSQRRKVPEPSAMLGLIAFFLLAAKRQKEKGSQTAAQ
ncbi:hypothetical protein Riv7116_1449 [Rivularia sp. PCC 7116]|nr:hypothetical protein Riv7116_1449 [Rivularia sp. PCC 7116]